MKVLPIEMSPEASAVMHAMLIVLVALCAWLAVRCLYQCLVQSVANKVIVAKVSLLSPQPGDTILVTSTEYITANTRNVILSQFKKVVGEGAKVMVLAPGLEVSMVKAAGITSNL